jgi:type II secretion system protein J
MTIPRGSSESGFTLVEALVSVFVFGLLAVGCVGMLATSVQTRGRLTAAEDDLRHIEVARALLSADMAQLLPAAPGEGVTARNAFIGQGAGVVTGRRIAFTRTVGEAGISPSAGAQQPGLSGTSAIDVEYRIDGQGRLIRRIHSRGAGPDAVQDRILFRHAGEARFEFNDGLRWRQDWAANVVARPAAVAIVIDLPRYGSIRLSAFAGTT